MSRPARPGNRGASGTAPRFQLVAVGRGMPAPIKTLVEDYRQRLERHGGCALTEVAEEPRPPKQGGDPSFYQRKEAERLLPLLAGGGLTVFLDAGGRRMDSLELAREAGRWRDEGVKPVRFVIGGPDGLLPELLGRGGDWSLSLGPMTFPHMLVRVLLLEQLYRAMTLLEGIPYHR